jgi:succinate-acetate transporter protein
LSESSHPPVPKQGTDPLTVFDPGKIEPDLRAMIRFVLRPIGSPLPLGFFTLAIDSVLVSAFQWGLLPAADHRAVALIVIPAFVVQLIVGILAFISRDSIAATLMMSFATTWLVDALVFYSEPPGYADAIGIFFILFGVFAAFMLTTALLKRALALVLIVAVPRFLVSGIAELTGVTAVARAAAVLGFLLTAVAMYTAFALLLEDSRGREVLPVGRLGPARHATHDNLAFQLRDIERQAGVRRTL